MAERFKTLRSLGEWGGWVANILVFLMTNWALAGAAAVGVFAGAIEGLRTFALTPAVYVSVGVFLAVFWTFVGVRLLAEARKPRLIQAHHDYRYGLTFEGLYPQFYDVSTPLVSAREVFAILA